jgi:acyl-coenzyme A synthetase/AMP-(fatty) acid ligase
MSDDEMAGIDWWNSQSEVERGAWLYLAGSAVPADAWAYFKAHPPVNNHSVSGQTDHGENY